VTLVITFFLSVLLRPLRLLTDAAIRLEQGDLSTPVPELPADEVGRLGNVMRSLVARLVVRFGELRTAVQISHTAIATIDQSQMLSEVTRALTARLGYPDARIYLTGKWSQRSPGSASGTQAERIMRAGRHVAVDETTVVGRAILLGGRRSAPRRIAVADSPIALSWRFRC
jgi:HAMP domain-containing protein